MTGASLLAGHLSDSTVAAYEAAGLTSTSLTTGYWVQGEHRLPYQDVIVGRRDDRARGCLTTAVFALFLPWRSELHDPRTNVVG